MATTSSNQMAEVDLSIWDNGAERPDIRSCPSVGQPVSVATGNVYFDQTDAAIPGEALHGLTFVRAYNSANAAPGRFGIFGPGWSHGYEKRITSYSPTVLVLRDQSGVVSYFTLNPTSGRYEPSTPFSTDRWIRVDGNNLLLEFKAGGSERYQSIAAGGRLTAITDIAGNTTTLGYEGNQVESVSDTGGRQLLLDYVGPDTITLSGPAGLIATYSLTNGLLTSVQYADSADDGSEPDGGYSFTYHAAQPPEPPEATRVHTTSDADGKIIETHEYHTDGKAMTSEISGGINRFTLVYAPLKTTVTDANGNIATYEYTNVGGMRKPTKTTSPCASCPGGAVQEWTYDTKGRVLTRRDGEGYTTTYTYDQLTGGVVSETRVVDISTGAAYTTSYTYWPEQSAGKGRLHTRTAPNSAVTTYEYGVPGPTKITEQIEAARFRETNITYTPAGEPGAGKVKFIEDARHKVWEYHYLPNGDLEWIKDPVGNETRFTYDQLGRQKQVIRPTLLPVPNTPNDPPIQEPETTYDMLGRVSRIRNTDDGTTTRFTYDGGGRRRTMTDALGRVTEWIYDPYGRLWKMKDAELNVTEYGYDAASNLTSIKDARAKMTTFLPDSANRVERVCYPLDEGEASCFRYEQFTYDAVGRVETRRDRRGVVTTFHYDGLGRLKSKTYSDGTPAVTYGYDEGPPSQKGRLTSAVTGPIALGWSYDLAGEALRRPARRARQLTRFRIRTTTLAIERP